LVSLRGFSTINVWADDVAAAAAWYTEFLGVEPYFARSGPGNVLGVMYNPHYLDVLASAKPA
jgi:hypothetical protein